MTDALDEEATQGEQAAKWWKWAAVTICSLLLVSTLVLGILVVFLAKLLALRSTRLAGAFGHGLAGAGWHRRHRVRSVRDEGSV